MIDQSNNQSVEPSTRLNDSSQLTRSRQLVLLSFVSFFIYALIVWYETSRVTRVQLPSIDQASQYVQILDERIWPIHLIVDDAINSEDVGSSFEQAIQFIQSTSPYQLLPVIISSNHQPIQQSNNLTLPPLLLYLAHSTENLDWQLEDGVLKRYVTANADVGLASELIDVLQTVLTAHIGPSEEDTFLTNTRVSHRISLTLMTAEPDPFPFDWDFASLEANFLDAFVTALEPVLKLTVDSQVLLHGNIAPITHRGRNAANQTIHYVKSDELANFIGRTDFNVESPFASSTIELLAYIPPGHQSPLFVGEKSKQSVDDSFIVPGWGAVCIVNEPSANGTDNNQSINNDPLVMLDSKTVHDLFERFASQLRIIFGLSDTPLSDDGSILAQWETDALIQRFLHVHAQHANKTLHSLYELIQSTPHMPVHQHIADRCQMVIDRLRAAHASCLISDWRACGRHYRAASLWSSRAFYDPSMLPMLHFPSEHMYAVYAPFFAPIVLPVLGGLIKAIKSRRLSRKVKES